jgi:hypothetical protein
MHRLQPPPLRTAPDLGGGGGRERPC